MLLEIQGVFVSTLEKAYGEAYLELPSCMLDLDWDLLAIVKELQMSFKWHYNN